MQGELSVDRLTEGLVLTNKKRMKSTLPPFSYENATEAIACNCGALAAYTSAQGRLSRKMLINYKNSFKKEKVKCIYT